jgi:hypothetical protein
MASSDAAGQSRKIERRHLGSQMNALSRSYLHIGPGLYLGCRRLQKSMVLTSSPRHRFSLQKCALNVDMPQVSTYPERVQRESGLS